MKQKTAILAVILMLAALPGFAAVGIFEQEADWELDTGAKVAGSAEEADGIYTLQGNGDDIWGAADEGFYIYSEKPASESWVISGKVAWNDPGESEWAKIGPMVRATGDAADSANVSVAFRGALDLVSAQYRSTDAAATTSGRYPDTEALAEKDPADDGVYLRIGYWAPLNLQYIEVSEDGSNWVHILTADIDHGDTLAYGFAITNHLDNDFLAEGTVSDVVFEQLTDIPAPLNRGPVGEFENQLSLGSFTLQGEAEEDNGVYTVTGGGEDIWGSYDQGHFVYKEMSGAFEAEAQVFPIMPSTNAWTKGGLMVREELGGSSPHGFALLKGNDPVEWHLAHRTTKGGGSTNSDGVAFIDTAEKIKIVKLGSLIQSYYLDANEEWILLSETNVEIDDSCYLGLAVTSHERWQWSTYEFSDVAITEYPFYVERTPATVDYTPGQVVDIEVKAVVREGETLGSLTIQETVPTQAAEITNISNGGTLSDGVITWNLTDVSQDTTVSYSVVAPNDINVVKMTWGSSTSSTDGFEVAVAGTNTLNAVTFNAYATFSYPSNDNANSFEGESIDGRDGGYGWGENNPWTTSEDVVLNTNTLDAGVVKSQPTLYNPGNYSAQLSGEVQDGLSRSLPVVVDGGELWISFTYMEEGPAADHWSGMTLYNDQDGEVSFIGKPFGAEFCGIGNLPDGDAVTEVSYQQANHFLVRIQVNGGNSTVSLWINPDKEDRVDTFDAQGADEIDNIAQFALRRGGATGSAYYDNLWFSSVPALPPAGAGRVDLRIDDPERPDELPAWDVISVDQIDDALVGAPGFGHDNGEDHYLVVSGFLYFPDLADLNQQIVAFGLPVDRMSGLNGHMLGHFNNAIEAQGLKNAMKFEDNDQQRGPFTFDVVPAGNYSELRSAQTVANGDGQLFCTLIYEDGTTEDTFLHSDDWYHDGGEIDYENTRQMVDGMNRLQGSDSNFDDRFDPAVFECFIPVNPDKVLTQVTLEFDPSVEPAAAYNLFDIWCVPAGVEPGVDNWLLY